MRAYVSCHLEKDQPKVTEFVQFLTENHVDFEFPPTTVASVETAYAIDRCDAFVAVFTKRWKDYAPHHIELQYATRLCEALESISVTVQKPRLFGLKLSDPPDYVSTIKALEWLSADKDSWRILLTPVSKRDVENEFFDKAVEQIRESHRRT